MATTWNLSKGLAAVVTASAAAFGLCPSAAADPATPQPNSTEQLPGLPALSQLSPIIQQAAGNPAQATQLLMAAAQAFTHNPTAPTESKNVAASVNQFVQEPGSPLPGAPAPNGVIPPDGSPVPHVPPAGVVARRAGTPADRHRPGPRGRSGARRCATGHTAGFRAGARDCCPRCGTRTGAACAGPSARARGRTVTGSCARRSSRRGPGFRT